MTTSYRHTTLRTAAMMCILTAIGAAISAETKTPRQMFGKMPTELHIANAQALPDSISPNTMRYKAADGTTMEITSTGAAGASASLFCLLTTRSTPEPETTCDIYTQDWQKVKSIPLAPFAASLTAKPDTMDVAEYGRRLRLIELPLVEAHFTSKVPATLELTLHVPLLGKEDKQRVNAILVKKEYKIVNEELHSVD